MKRESFFANIRHDIPASLVVFLVALPLCLGVALASGAPLFSGLIAGIVGGMVVSVFSGSQLSVSGPAAGLTAIVLSSISELGTYQAFLTAVVIAGALQFILGLFRAGAIANYIPSSVIKGMLASIGIILILKQIPHAFGYDAYPEGTLSFFEFDQKNTFSILLDSIIKQIHLGATIIALLSVGILIAWDMPWMKRFKGIPAALIVVLVSIFANQLFLSTNSSLSLYEDHLVNIPVNANLSEFLGQFILPDFSAVGNSKLWIVAITIAMVASIESLLSLEAVDKIDPQKRHSSTSMELKAQGIGNMISGIIGGLPVTSVIVRSSANVQSGAKSKASAFFHGLLLLLSALFIPGLLNLIPLAGLAAILIMTGYKLVNIKIFKKVYAQGWSQFFPFIVTILAIIFTDLLIGIGIGLCVSIFHILQTNLRNSYFFRKEHYNVGEVIRIELSEEVSFLNKAPLLLTLENIPAHSKVILDASGSVYIDMDVLEVIQEFKNEKAIFRQIQLNLVGFKDTYKKFNNVSFLPGPTKDSQALLTPEKVLQILKDGNERFISNRRSNEGNTYLLQGTAQGQYPHAVILSCMDSRSSAEIIFDQNIGDIFSIRVAGNVVNRDIIASMEYACKVAGSKLIVILGHTKCGAIQGACDGNIDAGYLPMLFEKIEPAINAELEIQHNRNSSNPSFVKSVTRHNIFVSMKKIREMSPILNEMLEEQMIALVGALYDIETGKVTFYEDFGALVPSEEKDLYVSSSS